jgi:predicted transposase YbfD/YdcC
MEHFMLNIVSGSFLSYFSSLDDHREPCKVLYPLDEILLLILGGTLSGAEDFYHISLWGKTKLAYLREFLPYKHEIPSHDTLNHVMNELDTRAFTAIFEQWLLNLRDKNPEIIAVDGKTSRRAHGSGEDDKALHVVSAWASRQRLVLGQEACAEKSNEITAIPLLLERIDLKGALVTIDAMGCQTKIADKIIEGGGDYLFGLKDNQRSLAREVEAYFDDKPQKTTYFETLDGDHGRIELRKHTISQEIDWLIGAKNATGEPRFRNLTSIGMIENEITHKKTGEITKSRRFYISSLALDAQFFAKAARAHWGVENRLHWMLDVVFHDDLMRLRTENGAKNMKIIKHAALNLIKLHPKKGSFKGKQKLAGWDEKFLTETLTQKY